MTEQIERVALADARGSYHMGSPQEAALIEAVRLIEVETRVQHGDAAWEAMTA